MELDIGVEEVWQHLQEQAVGVWRGNRGDG